MAKKKKAGGSTSGFHCTTLREESSGRKEIKGLKNVNSMLKLQHLQKLATWASGEASIPPLGALFGHNVASGAESLGIPLDPSIFQCQRCETILQPSRNCTVRIEKVTTKAKRRKKSSKVPQNNVVYTCHFCSHRNLKRGTPKGYMKEIQAGSRQSLPESFCNLSRWENASLKSETASGSKSKGSRCQHVESTPVTPLQKAGTVTESMKLKSGQRSTKSSGVPSSTTLTEHVNGSHGSSKRRKRGWTSLKEIAERSEQAYKRKLDNLTIPFLCE